MSVPSDADDDAEPQNVAEERRTSHSYEKIWIERDIMVAEAEQQPRASDDDNSVR